MLLEGGVNENLLVRARAEEDTGRAEEGPRR